MGDARNKVLLWDFWGPDATGTARRFQEHLLEFLTAQRIEGCHSGMESAAPNHQAVWCNTPPDHVPLLEQRLRPKRALWEDARYQKA